jgi:hypothetical protein
VWRGDGGASVDLEVAAGLGEDGVFATPAGAADGVLVVG